MHNLYEGIFQDMFLMIPDAYWREFESIYLKQKFPSFLHRHPRTIISAGGLHSMKAIEVYLICHFFLRLFQDIDGYKDIEERVLILSEMVTTMTCVSVVICLKLRRT